ncbi:uncharacterized protein ACIBXB_018917 [Morphnus guianensis]
MESISLVSEVFQLQLQEELGSQRLFGLGVDHRMADSISSLSKGSRSQSTHLLPELFSLQESHLSRRFNRAEGCPVACRDIFSLQRRASGMTDQQSYTSPAPVLHFLAQKRSSGCRAGAKAALRRHLLCSLCKGDTRLRWPMVFPGPMGGQSSPPLLGHTVEK